MKFQKVLTKKDSNWPVQRILLNHRKYTMTTGDRMLACWDAENKSRE